MVVVKGVHPRSITTTTTIRLAQLFAFASESCLVIDLGPRGDASRRMGSPPTESGLLPEILRGKEPGGRLGLLERSVAPGLDLIPYDLAVEDLAAKDIVSEAWSQALREFCAQYQWILIDCPPANPKLLEGCLGAADELLLTATKDQVDFAKEWVEPTRPRTTRFLQGLVKNDRASLDPAIWQIPDDGSYARPDNADWDDLEDTLEARATRAYVALTKELRSGG